MSLKEVLVIGSLHYDIFLESQQLPRIGETTRGQKWYPKLAVSYTHLRAHET